MKKQHVLIFTKKNGHCICKKTVLWERELYCCHGRDVLLEMINRSQAVPPDNISERDLLSAAVPSVSL